LRHLSLVSGPALTAGVITGGGQTDPAIIKAYLNRYTPGVSIMSAFEEPSSAANTQASAASPDVSVSSTSAVSTQPVALSLSIENNDTQASAVAATQRAHQSVTPSSPWVSDFVGSDVTEDEEEVMITL
jgi:hypothetical protein